jgi:hypothetical protein
MYASIPRRHRVASLFAAVLVATLGGCGSNNNNNNNPDGATGDDGGGQQQKFPVLRKNIGLDLAQVNSFAVVGNGSGGVPAWSGGDTATLLGALEGQGLVALMNSGDVTPVTLVEMSDGSTATNNQLQIHAIYATPQWVLMNGGGQIYKAQPDGTPVPVACLTIAVHRPDGAMYCANIGIRDSGNNGDTIAYPVHANSSGSIVYLMSMDSLNRNVIYKLVAAPTGEPVATLVDAKLHPNWFVVNGSGDLLAQSSTSDGVPGGSLTQIVAVDASQPVTLTGAHNEYAIAGTPTSTEADTFFVVSGGGGGYPFDGTIRVLKKTSGKFQETNVQIAMADMNCSGLFPLADGAYMFCGGQSGISLARALVDGQVQTSPVVKAFTGITSPNQVSGLPFRAGGGVFYLYAKGANGHFFARHNGVAQQDIPVSADLEVLSMTATNAGGLDLVGVDNKTNSKVRATIRPGEMALTILSAEGVSLAEVVVFTRIN